MHLDRPQPPAASGRLERLRQRATALAALALLLAACRTHLPPERHEPDASAPTPIRAWLVDTLLLAEPGGRAQRAVEGPALVEVFLDGRVRSVQGAEETFEGYLPDEIAREPHGRKGLMLYAQRLTDLTVEGAVVGRLHPGAVVGIAAPWVGEARVAVHVQNVMQPDYSLLAHVDLLALGVTPSEPAPVIPRGRGRSMLMPTAHIDVRNPVTREAVNIALAYCHEIWYPEEGNVVTQIMRGIELRGEVYPTAALVNYGPRTQDVGFCPIRAVSRGDGVLFLTEPDAAPRPVDRPPAGFVPVRPEETAGIAKLIEAHATVHWMVVTEKGTACESWRFGAAQPEISAARFEHLRSEPSPPGTTEASLVRVSAARPTAPMAHPVMYRPPSARKPAELQFGPTPSTWCNCMDVYEYAVLALAKDELAVTAQRVPVGIEAYDPGDAERWFLSRRSCESARVQAAATLAADGSKATRLGFHVPEL